MLCRLVQGFATGGEYGTSATYMSEAATRERRGFFSSFQYVTLVGGHVLAQFTLLILLSVLSDESGRRIRLADSVRHRRRRRDGGVLAAPQHGRIALAGALEAVREGKDKAPARCASCSRATGGRWCCAS